MSETSIIQRPLDPEIGAARLLRPVRSTLTWRAGPG
jgi:hypothetical protein